MNSNFYSKPDEQKQPVSFAPAGKRIQPFGLKRSRKRLFNFKSGSSGSLQRLHYSQELLFSLGMKGKTTGEYLYQCSEAQKLPLHFGCSREQEHPSVLPGLTGTWDLCEMRIFFQNLFSSLKKPQISHQAQYSTTPPPDKGPWAVQVSSGDTTGAAPHPCKKAGKAETLPDFAVPQAILGILLELNQPNVFLSRICMD